MTDTPTRHPASRQDRVRVSPTPRILTMLSEVARYGVLTTEQVARLDGGSRQKVTRFLQALVEDAKLLRRVDRTPQAFLSTFFDARPRVFAITPKGLRFLADAGIVINVAPKRANVLLAHEIETANFCFQMRSGVAARSDLRLINEPELRDLMPLETRQLQKPMHLQSVAHPRDFPHLGDLLKEPLSLTTEPDRLLVIARLDNSGWSFAAEVDRANENLSARTLRGKATWARKVIGYYTAVQQHAHLTQWGEFCRSFRVITITTSDARIKNMIEIQQHTTRGPAGLFLYSTPQRLAEHGPLGPAWISAKRNDISLFDRE